MNQRLVKTLRSITIKFRLISLDFLILSLIVSVGFVLRMLAQSHLKAITPDGIAYIFHTTKILNGTLDFERRGPFFQLLLISIFKIFGVSYASSLIIPQFFGSIIPIVTFFLARRFFDSKTGLIAALLMAVNPMLINLSCWVLRETLILTLILTFILTSCYSVETESKNRSLLATALSALLTGLLILTREDLIFVIPLAFIAYIYFRKKELKDLIARMSIYLIVTILTLSPWLLYSSGHFGHPLYSYIYYFPRGITEGGDTGGVASFLAVLYRVISGLWNELTVFSAIFSPIGLVFLSIGVMFTLKKRAIWIIYFLMVVELFLLSYNFGRSIYLSELVPHKFFDVDRIILSVMLPANIIIAYGVKEFVSFLLPSDRLPSDR